MTGLYIETTLTIIPYIEDAADIMAALLADAGYETFIPTENGTKCYILKENYESSIVDEAISQNPFECTIIYNSIEVEDEDWNKRWVEESFTPISIDNDCVIHSPKHQIEENIKYDILINPIMAFGSGHHQTTAMMVKWILNDKNINGKSVLDMGCGTAILAIVAKKCGAGNVCAIDIDERAYNNAKENIALNGCSDIEVRLGGAEAIGDSKFDIILANINKNILLSDMSIYSSALKPGGSIYVSGFFVSDIEDLSKCASQYGLTKVAEVSDEEWASVKFSKI
ncbi:MAG: 50S ribosomal protein L11 methyltransferase [Bacteroidales bacterium]|nr:50S ribosomal protein L11 methyltransferase [Bacteroidales bacterium]